MIRRQLRGLLNGYIPKRALIEEIDKYVVPPHLGNHSGVLGAILLARDAYLRRPKRVVGRDVLAATTCSRRS
jgi:hypothetical protein